MNTERFRVTVPMFGLEREITTARQVELELADGAGMREVIAAMRAQLPELDGPVFCKGEDRLVEAFKFNINGRFYFEDMDFQLHPGDRIALLTPITGG
jgi:molybdopterin converting factor small subunit